MRLLDSSLEWTTIIAAAADVSLKPWKHAVVISGADEINRLLDSFPDDLIFRIECRSLEGKRCPENDLDLEVFRSGDKYNLMISWSNDNEKPILWQGQHALWMESISGSTCKAPNGGKEIESLARRLRAIFADSI